MRIILASASPRRVDLLGSIISKFDQIPTDVDEITTYKLPHKVVMDLAKKKSLPLLNLGEESLVISADTLVYMAGKFYPKPVDTNQAFDMLRELSGNTHSVYSGVAIIFKGQISTFYDKSKVTIPYLSDKEIYNYIDKFKPFDKAGAYGIQDEMLRMTFTDSYTNIMGLPMEKLIDKLVELEVLGGDYDRISY